MPVRGGSDPPGREVNFYLEMKRRRVGPIVRSAPKCPRSVGPRGSRTPHGENLAIFEGPKRGIRQAQRLRISFNVSRIECLKCRCGGRGGFTEFMGNAFECNLCPCLEKCLPNVVFFRFFVIPDESKHANIECVCQKKKINHPGIENRNI